MLSLKSLHDCNRFSQEFVSVKIIQGIFDNEALSRILSDESYDLQISSVDDESCHGIPSLLENLKYESLVKDQRLNKSNIANRWNSFVNGELILKSGYVLKLKGLFLEKRMMLLTGEFSRVIFF